MISIHELFERQCAKTANKIAIQYGDDQITYATLNSKANDLSLAIKAKFPIDPIIAISSTRNVELIVSIIAILKAGKAYLPLDPAYPAARLLEIVKDAGINACLATGNEEGLFEKLGLQVLNSDAVYNLSIVPHVDQGSLAYTLYTSGSTGKPKGVCMAHHALVNLLDWQKLQSKASSRSNTLQFAPLSFDVSFQEIFATLTTGGKLILIEDDLRLDTYRLLQFIKESSVHRLFLPFVALQQLAEVANANNFFPACLEEIITAGEQLKITPQIRNFFSMLPDCILYNQYGPTETHVVTSLKLEGNPALWPSLPTIGKVIDHTQIFILDENLNLTPQGGTGELCVAGACLADGYLNNSAMTGEKFISWQHPDQGRLRIYRTGDLGRWLADAAIEFLGRKDDQVKIRGYRIELGEIEVALNKMNSVQQAVVTAREDIPGQKRLIAYLVSSDHTNDTNNIRKSLQKALPEYMMPSAFVWLNSLPKTSSGKVDRKSLPKPGMSRPELSSLYKAPGTEAEKRIAALWCSLLALDAIGTEDNFFELGGNSLLAVKTVVEIKRQFNYDLPITKLYQHPTIKKIAAYFTAEKNTRSETKKITRPSGDVAVIGMAGRFPGADTIEELWNILKNGKETIRFFTNEELHYTISENLKNDPSYVKARGILNNADKFDAAFFGINRRVAELMDPQQRIFLEIAWEVLEQTGHLPDKYNGSIGVFAGCGNNSYYQNNVVSNKELVDKVGAFQVMTVNEKDYISTRVAYQLNLKGPAVSVYSGCSTSLLAIAQAAESIRNGNCQVALAGGVAVHAPIHSGQYYEEGAMFSPDGHCRPFDKAARGTVFSDGAGIVLLKAMEDAITDGDTIYAVLKGIGYNNDGANKASFTAPSAEGQAGAILQAIHDAGIEPSAISYIETHGTATPLGDPIEIDGLQLAFGPQQRKQFCAIGSLKSNMGHLTAAAGVAGFIKTILSLYHGQLPPSLHYKESNPNIQFEGSPFFVNTSLRDWESDQLRRAGVSSFGVGGTNVHIVLEEYENTLIESGKQKPFTLVNWSAKTENSREGYATLLHQNLEGNPSQNIADMGYTLQTSRPSFIFRRFIVAGNSSDLRDSLSRPPSPATSMKLQEKVEEIAFLFPGQGSQYVNMGIDLYLQEPVFKEAVDNCALILQKLMNKDIRKLLFPGEENTGTDHLDNTYYTQPALFTIEYAMAKLWMSWGIRPSVLIGHSIGEFVAAHLAGIFSLQDALKLIVSRSSMMSRVQPGSMLSVQCTEEEIQSQLPSTLSIAAINTSKACVISGPSECIEFFAAELKAKGVASRVLNTSHAFHSAMMDGIVEPFLKVVQEITLNTPKIPVISTVTGKLLTDDEATDAGYWSNQLRATVRFADALNTVYADQKRILLEVGPGNITATLARQQLRTKSVTAVAGISKDHKSHSEYYTVLESLGSLWLNGVEPDWEAFYSGQQRKKLLLPSYAFDRQHCWVEPFQHPVPGLQKELPGQIPTQNEENYLPGKSIVRKDKLIPDIMQILEDASGIEKHAMLPDVHFMALGLDSLSLTQISLLLKQRFSLPITFRQLMEEYNTVNRLADFIERNLPSETNQEIMSVTNDEQQDQQVKDSVSAVPHQNDAVLNLVLEQIQLLSNKVSLLQNEIINKNNLAGSAQRHKEAFDNKFSQTFHGLIDPDLFSRGKNKERESFKYRIEETPPIPGAKLGQDEMGNAAWFINDPDRPGKYLQLVFNDN